jgi:hypothetical protein
VPDRPDPSLLQKTRDERASAAGSTHVGRRVQYEVCLSHPQGDVENTRTTPAGSRRTTCIRLSSKVKLHAGRTRPRSGARGNLSPSPGPGSPRRLRTGADGTAVISENGLWILREDARGLFAVSIDLSSILSYSTGTLYPRASYESRAGLGKAYNTGLHGERGGKLPASVGLAAIYQVRVPVHGLRGENGSRGRCEVGSGGRENSRRVLFFG